MNRPRKKDRHLPPCVYHRHGAYWYVKGGKWESLGSELGEALAAYARKLSTPTGTMPALIERAFDVHCRTVAASTREQYRVAADKLKKAFAEFNPDQVKPKHVAALKVATAAHPNMSNRVMSFLRVVFGYALEWQLVESNPCIGIRRHEEKKRSRYLTDDEFSAILEHAPARLQVIMRLCYLTGQRIGDVLAIHRKDIGPEGITFRPKKVAGSTGVGMVLAWTPELRAAVEQCSTLNANIRSMTLLHGRGGKPVDYRTVALQFTKAAEAAKVEDVTLHDLRAKALTDASRQGLDPQAIGGHTTAQMTARYIRLHETPVIQGPSFGRSNRQAGNS
ncbi:MAG: tyrosine-type recombinase/integrase [Rubrivivax sp.]|nr:tyrosine-type recombinase/integrase [Rubrivivax sp.]